MLWAVRCATSVASGSELNEGKRGWLLAQEGSEPHHNTYCTQDGVHCIDRGRNTVVDAGSQTLIYSVGRIPPSCGFRK